MIATRLRLVVMLLAFNVHEIQLIDQAAILEQGNRSIDRGAVNVGIALFGDPQQGGRVQMAGASCMMPISNRRWAVIRMPLAINSSSRGGRVIAVSSLDLPSCDSVAISALGSKRSPFFCCDSSCNTLPVRDLH